jgi:hypothetical protein
MAQPASRNEFKEYCLRQLGAPVLEINLATEQCDDIIDDAIQYFQERHFDGVSQTFMKYRVTQDDIDRGRASTNGNYGTVGIGYHFDGINTATNNMFSVKYQLFLNDIYYWGSTEILTYAMTKTYLEDIQFLLTTQKQIRFNQRMDRLYLDIDWASLTVGDFIIIDCFRALNPNDYSRVWNDSFLKRYTTALMKRQWGQNLLKFQGVKLPGGVELNGRQIYDDGMKDLEIIREQMSNTYELPPLDMIG